MKSLLRSTFINSLSLFFLTQLLSGVRVSGGLSTFILGGLVLSLMFNFLKPLMGIISLPLNIITMGSFSFLINIFIFYIATSLVGNISIREFTYPGVTFAGFVIPHLTFNTFFAYGVSAFLQSVFVSFLTWLRK